MQDEVRRRRIEEWQVEGLRLTAFAAQAFTVDAKESTSWWAELVGQPPERELSRPRESRWQADGRLSGTDLSNAKLVLSVDRHRIDWVLGPDVDREGPLGIESSHLGSFPTVLPVFLDMMRVWLTTTAPDLNRLALGVSLRLPVESREQGYQVISAYLPFDVDPASSDFLYRINRPTTSQSLGDGTSINRLTTWSVVQIETMIVSLSPTGATRERPEGEPFVACHLELDINTEANRTGELPHNRLDDALNELAEISTTIAERGDVS